MSYINAHHTVEDNYKHQCLVVFKPWLITMSENVRNVPKHVAVTF